MDDLDNIPMKKLIDCHKGLMGSLCLNTSWTASMNEFADTGSSHRACPCIGLQAARSNDGKVLFRNF